MKPKISIIGSGNVAWHLANRLVCAGVKILEVYGRNPSKEAPSFQSISVGLTYLTDIKLLGAQSDIYIICVHDDAIPSVVKSIPFAFNDEQILIHTSGSVSSNVLACCSKNYAVLWPVMTLTKQNNPQNIESIPYVITPSNADVASKLKSLVYQFSNHISVMSDENRIKLHLAAVMVNNFSNHLYTLTLEYCEKMGLDFALLKELIRETAFRVQSELPSTLQTGPAKRNDHNTIHTHLKMLETQQELQKIYQVFSESIIQKYHPK